ncbi:MAG TPA: hypothetical protein DCY40_03690 [Actinobacteria bacterium]|nr:hypothetical protein [Actinomycetota bacterium]
MALTAPVADPGSFLSGESPSTTVSVDATDEVVTTTMPVPSELEPAGVALQDEIVADGVVSREERERAVAAMAECMTSHGVTGVTWSVTWSDEGDWFQEMEWDSPTADAHLLTEALCYYSYLDRVDSALSASDR